LLVFAIFPGKSQANFGSGLSLFGHVPAGRAGNKPNGAGEFDIDAGLYDKTQ